MECMFKKFIFGKTFKTRYINLSMCSTYANCVRTAYKNYKLLLRNDLDKYDVCVFIGLWKWNIVNCRLNGI